VRNFAYGGTKDFNISISSSTGNYCVSGPTSTGGIQLGRIQLQGITTKIDENTTCPGGIGPQLLLNQSADLVQGTSFTLNYSVVICGNASSYASAAWIDFNQDSRFDEWEQITPQSALLTNTRQFKVPMSTGNAQVLPGTTRLRVQVQTAVSGALNPCKSDFLYGGTKDFTVNISTTLIKNFKETKVQE